MEADGEAEGTRGGLDARRAQAYSRSEPAAIVNVPPPYRASGARMLAAALLVIVAAGCRTVPSGLASHTVVGAWTLERDGKPGFRRLFRPDGTVTVWWPDGRIAGEGRFEAIDDLTVAVKYPNGDTDVVRLIEPDAIRIERVELRGVHWKYYARREAAAADDSAVRAPATHSKPQ